MAFGRAGVCQDRVHCFTLHWILVGYRLIRFNERNVNAGWLRERVLMRNFADFG